MSMADLQLHPHFLVDAEGKRKAVQLAIEEYDKLMEILENLEDIEDLKAARQALETGKMESVPFSEVEARLRREGVLKGGE